MVNACTVFSGLNAGGVYFKLGPVDPAFIRGPTFNRENSVIKKKQNEDAKIIMHVRTFDARIMQSSQGNSLATVVARFTHPCLHLPTRVYNLSLPCEGDFTMVQIYQVLQGEGISLHDPSDS